MLIKYLIVINIISALIFIFDKISAVYQSRRVPEAFLHLLEILGGVFVVFPLMFIIRHKNRKISYQLITVIILFLWVVMAKYLLTGNLRVAD